MEWSWRVKLRQAEAHVERFSKEAADYLESSRAGFDYIADEKAGTIDVVLRADFEPPVGLGAIVGDVLHNLRSALDAIAWEACRRTGVALTAKQERQIYFPITWEVDQWEDAAKRLIGVSAEHLEAFKYLQPWYFDEQGRQLGVEIPKEFAKNEPLWQLQELAKVDRHRTLHPLLAQAGDTWLGTPEGVETTLAGVDRPPWQPGSTILRWSVRPVHRVRDASPAGEAVLTLAKSEDLRPQSALGTLQGLVAATDRALRHVEIEVLHIVTPAELAELTALGEQWQDAQRAVQQARHEPGVLDRERFERQKALMASEERANEAYRTRWQELFR
ncbi:MAG: hypothetical protein JWO62_557 [Acidimicrobiaceae bacterium]|nr:hypothetical protein [Acidimicrobiaceae bacterium]